MCVDGCHGQDSGDACEVNNKSELQSACRPLQTFRTLAENYRGPSRVIRAPFTDENARGETTDRQRLFISVDPFLRN